jgi:hypothetical protein
MVTSNFFLSQNMMTFEYFKNKNPLLNFHCVFFLGPQYEFTKYKNAAIQDVKRMWKNIRSGNQCLGGWLLPVHGKTTSGMPLHSVATP